MTGACYWLLVLGLVPIIASAARVHKRCKGVFDAEVPTRSYNNTCYAFVKSRRVNYNTASADCQQHGGSLAIVPNRDVNNFLARRLKKLEQKGRFWIGLTDREVDTVFKWIDGTDFLFHAFRANQGPDAKKPNVDEDCVVIDAKRVWHEHYCQEPPADSLAVRIDPHAGKKRYICQFPLPPEAPSED